MTLLRCLLLASALSTFVAAQTNQSQTPPEPEQPDTKPPLKTTVTVNATISSETPASITVLDKKEIETIPGINLDDRLRQVPGFSLFRRSSSVVANPTTQGVSLRATGSTGASRTLVLWDSIPVNDPFGGWVYWTRIDPEFISEVDVDRGASTSVFGDRAMGGTISLFSPEPQRQHVFADVLGGGEGTSDVSAAYSDVWGPWGLTVHSRDLTTDGYYIVPPNLRGRVDTEANVRFATGEVVLDYARGADRLAIHLDLLAEERQNGTQLTHNSTGLGTLGGHYTHNWSNDQISVLAFHTQEQFHSTFSSVALNRNTETLTSRQTVPVSDYGGAAYWHHHGTNGAFKWNTIVGADADDTHGISYDFSYSTRVLARSGGTLLEHGLFGQGDVSIGPVRFFAGIRHQFTGRNGETFISPNGGVALGVRRFRLRAAGYRSFRAPTLNELYRQFRVGNALTLANSGLVPEGLTGVETGVDWSGERTRVSFSLFRNELDNLIDNATLSTSPTLILRMRQNFPAALSRGMEASATRTWRHWTAEGAYLYADARLSTGQRIPEIPKQQGTAQLTFSAQSTLLSGGIRAFGLQFDDDLNQFLLPGFATVGFTAEQHITRQLTALASVDNLLNRTYLVALTPTPNTGEPRIWRLGLRWNGKIR
jgi:outer membrane cobalamin receptor